MSSERKKILNPNTGRMVYADGKVGKEITMSSKSSKSSTTRRTPELPSDILKQIADISDFNTKDMLKSTNKLFGTYLKDSKSYAMRTAFFMESIIRTLMTKKIYSAVHFKANDMTLIIFKSAYKSELLFKITKESVNASPEEDKIILSMDFNNLKLQERKQFKLKDLRSFFVKNKYISTFENIVNNVTEVKIKSNDDLKKINNWPKFLDDFFRNKAL